jgi:hypothetical protein
LQTVELERDYRAACQKMLASLDLRSALNRMNEEIGRLHHSLSVEGAQILANPSDDDAIRRYRGMVENIVAKLDERDSLRQRDGFKGALQELLQLGEQLGYARKAEPAKPEPAPVKPAPVAVVAPAPVVVQVEPQEDELGIGAVEKELAELQQQLAQLQQT